MSYWLHPEAEAELGQAAVYYAEHASRAVAEVFLAEFERVRDLVFERTKRAGRMRTMACASITSHERAPNTVDGAGCALGGACASILRMRTRWES